MKESTDPAGRGKKREEEEREKGCPARWVAFPVTSTQLRTHYEKRERKKKEKRGAS